MSNFDQHLDAIAAFLVSIVGAIGAFLLSKSRADSKIITAKGAAHKDHAEADMQEAQARLTLDVSTREWADRLIERFDKENNELRLELTSLRKKCDMAMDNIREKYERAMKELREQYESEIEELKAQIRELQTENKNLMALYVKGAVHDR